LIKIKGRGGRNVICQKKRKNGEIKTEGVQTLKENWLCFANKCEENNEK
jgi:hypothetical protein